SPEDGDVLDRVMGSAEVTHVESAPGGDERHRQLVDRDVRPDLLRALRRKEGTDAENERTKSRRREPGRDRYRVALGDAGVDVAVGKRLDEGHGRGTTTNVGCDQHDVVALARQFDQRA